ncbi:acyl-coenzyme A thioesterase 8-like [Littorina saxatilis]|uniref:Acyl-coenzyme A thioesterase 8 n=1 Tax=Littorina saxatilis TaxID=31220 RepID=A0AAN9C0H4_9CAEN
MATKATSTAVQTTENDEDLESIITKSFLNLEKIDVDIYRSQHLWQPRGGRAVFGGQVVGQALAAAAYSVPADHHTHSLHCYFLRPGNYKLPILFTVDRTRDGNVYSSRSIKAMQEGRAIFTMQASFKTGETDPFQHQFTMPAVPSPEECTDITQLLTKAVGSEKKAIEYQKGMSHRLSKEQMSILRRPVGEYYSPSPLPPRRCVWIKAAGHLGDDYKMHQCCAAFMSDYLLLGTAIMPYTGGHIQAGRNFFMTSVDHAVWFHSEFRADDWLLYEMESPVCGEGRAFNTGRMWTRDGRLAISVAQEGVIRTRKSEPEGSDPPKSKL